MSTPASGAILRRTPVSILVAGAILAVFVLIALFAGLLAPADPARQSLLQRLRPPGHATAQGFTYWMGTDELGRDLLSRVLHGARASMAVAVASVAVSLAVGTALGLLAGWRRGFAEIAIMRLVDTMLSIPAILLAVLAVAVIGPGFQTLVLVLGLTRWPRYARVAYAQTLQVATLPYIRAANSRARARRGCSRATCCPTSPDRSSSWRPRSSG